MAIGNVQVDPLCAPQVTQALRMLFDHWPRVSKLAKCKKICIDLLKSKMLNNN
jgi:hypothetical protein